jgi:protein gp37
LLEEIDFLAEIDGERVIDKFQWIIIGGESGNGFGKYRYRPMQIEWMAKINKDLKDNTNIAIFNKQLGTFQAKKLGLNDRHGGNILEWPKYLRIRQYPQSEAEVV